MRLILPFQYKNTNNLYFCFIKIVFIYAKKEKLTDYILHALKSGNKDESTFSQEDWNQVAEIMQKLSCIPLLLKETSDVNGIKTETENFIKEMNKSKGVIIINHNELSSRLKCKIKIYLPLLQLMKISL